ncbi:MAG: hypothetical protein K2H33_07105 [Muribaculaceae bacterium]|nr:hypothetical protein [Muribaculaceae bacterium]
MEKEAEPKIKKKRRRGLWWKLPLWTLATVITVIAATLSVALWMLTPERLTGMVRKYGTEYLNEGRMDANRVELTWWSSFPRFELTVDSLAVRSLLPGLPPEASTLLSVERIHGAIDLAALLKGAVTIHDVTITRPSVFVYTGPDGHGNLDILPVADDTPASPDNGPLILPPLTLERFVIEGDAPLRYQSEADSIDVALTLSGLSVINDGEPRYSVSFSAMPHTALVALPDSFTIGLKGNVAWHPATPQTIRLNDMTVSAGELSVTVDAEADLAEPPTIASLSIKIEELDPNYAVRLARMQPGMDNVIPRLEFGGRLSLNATLMKPYVMTDTMLPAIGAGLELTDGTLAAPDMRLRFRNAALAADITYSPSVPDSSVVTLRRLELTGDRGATSVALRGTATNLFSDPKMAGHFNGSIILDQLPPILLRRLGAEISGRFRADTDFDLRLSDLSAATFHRARLNGRAIVSDLKATLPADSLHVSAALTELRFGTSTKVDSTLMVSVSIDTASMTMPEMTAQLSRLKMGIGCRNDASIADSTVITPMGGIIELERLRFTSAKDSLRAMLRGLKANASLLRHNGDNKIPELAIDMNARRIVYSQGLNRISLSRSDIVANMHLRPRRQRAQRTISASDSARIRNRRNREITESNNDETLDFGLDTKTTSLLRRLELDGSLTAARGRMFTPLFPLRTGMKNLNFHFTADSLSLHNVEITAGQSRFNANGSVSNIRRSITGGKRRRSPLKIGFNLHADTININELTQAAFRGAALAARSDSAAMALAGSVDLDDDALQASADSLAVSEIAAVLVPVNIDAELRFTADNIIYSTMTMHDFTGSLLVNNGAVSLQNLHALTDIGSIDLNALYYAPNTSNIDMAMALRLNRFKIGRVIELMPALDTIMPILGQIGGVIDVTLGATTEIDSLMNLKTPTIHAMMNMTGDSLVVLDESTFKTISKWLMFKDKQRNMIEHMSVELSVENSMLELYPFMFDFDRYRLGVMGRNDLDLNLNYHVSVLKSPLPFKFGINITGPADDMKIRIGKARYKNNAAAESVALADSVRVNLVQEIRTAFTRGVEAARVAPLRVKSHEKLTEIDSTSDTIPAEHLRQLEFIEK